MTSPFVLVVHLHAKPGCIELVQPELEKMLAPTRAEDGCISYQLHQDNADPAHFLFYEVWQSRKHWQAHLETAHLQAFRAATADTLASRQTFEMSRIG